MYLKQQAGERATLEYLKKQACESVNQYGMLTHMLLFGDGMTKIAGAKPKYGRRFSKSDSSLYQNRVFGVEVYCGPIRGEILFHTDELVGGGANLVIEIQRRGIFLSIA